MHRARERQEVVAVPSRELVERHTGYLNALSGLAQTDMGWLWDALDLTDPGVAAKAVSEAVPALAGRYGSVAALSGAGLYEDIRASEVGGRYDAFLAEPMPADKMARNVSYGARYLFEGNEAAAFSFLSGLLDLIVKGCARDTILENSLRDKRAVRFARVPQGSATCPFCMMLASRGFVYASRQTAGELNHFHPHCDCAIVPSFERSPTVGGYDPQAYYDLYMEACRKAGSGDTREILAAWRRMDRR
jgi:hypothetical protein